jgi:hypothetical protein
LDTVCHFCGKSKSIIAKAETGKVPYLQWFCNDGRTRQNREKGGFMTSDQKVAGSSPAGCTIQKTIILQDVNKCPLDFLR